MLEVELVKTSRWGMLAFHVKSGPPDAFQPTKPFRKKKSNRESVVASRASTNIGLILKRVFRCREVMISSNLSINYVYRYVIQITHY